MPKPVRIGKLETTQDLKFERREWRAEQIGWIVGGLLIVAALVGLFGSGPIAHASAGDEGGPIRVEYERFTRKQAATAVKIHVTPDASGRATIWISQSWLDGVEVEVVEPEPESSRLARDRRVLEFQTAESVGGPVTIVLDIRPKRAGRLSGRIGIEGGPDVGFGQLVYP